MRNIRYKGNSDVRTMRAADFTSVGINDQATVSWDRANNVRAVSDMAAAFLLANPTEFEDVAGSTFGDLQQSTGKELGFGGTLGVNGTTTSEADVAGVMCTFTPGADPFILSWDFLAQINNPTGGTLAVSALYKVIDMTAGGAGVQKMQITYKETVLPGSSALQQMHKERTFRGLPAGVQRSYKMTHQIQTAGCTGSVWGSDAIGEAFIQALGC